MTIIVVRNRGKPAWPRTSVPNNSHIIKNIPS
jgi:hypothetical protein